MALLCGWYVANFEAKGFALSNPLMFMSTNSMSRTFFLSLILSCLSFTTVSAQDWAEKMFNKREHDFGTVARGADTVYKFEVTNIYKQPMTISGVRSSTDASMMFMIPIPPTSSASAAMLARTTLNTRCASSRCASSSTGATMSKSRRPR